MLLLLLLAATASQPADVVVARVGSSTITASEVTARLHGGSDYQGAAQDLVNDTALAQAAEQLGYAKDPRVQAEIEQKVGKIAGEAFLAAEVDPSVKVDDRALAELFHLQSDSVRIRLIVLSTEKEAAASIARLKSGATFAAEARNSLDPRSRARSGEMSLALRGQLEPALQKVAFEAPLKQVTGPVQLELGWGVVQVLERSVASESDFAKERPKLLSFAEQQGRRQARAHYLGQLRKEAGAVVDERFVESTGKRLDASPAEEDHVVATVYRKPLRYRDVLPAIRDLAGGKTGGHFSGKTVKMEVIGAEVDSRVVAATALRKGYGNSPAALAALPAIRRDALVRAYAADLRKKVTVADAEVSAEYQSHLAQFTRPGHRRCSHVLSATEKESRELRARILKGERFDEVAQEKSLDARSAAQGGLIGDLSDDRLEAAGKDPGQAALVRALLTLPAGAVSEPVKSSAGWHLLRCEARVAPAPAPLAEVTPLIRAHLLQEKGDAAVREAIAAARARHPVQIDEPALKRLASRKS